VLTGTDLRPLLPYKCTSRRRCHMARETQCLGALTSLLLDPQKCAVGIAIYAHHYFAPNTSLVGAHHASFPLGAALHFLAVTCHVGIEADNSESEAKVATSRIRVLFRDVGRAKSTAEFLRSMAPDPAPAALNGDVSKTGAYEKRARPWLKI